MDDPPLRVPDGIEPISAYRAWTYSIERGRAHLFPLSSGSASSFTEWEGASSGWVTASCRAGNGHEVPLEGCRCGFYSVKDLQEAIGLALPMRPIGTQAGFDCVVLGRVLLSGKVIEHEIGYRAERARIAELIPFRGSERSVMVLANRLGVRMAAAVEPRARGWPSIPTFGPPPPAPIVAGSDDTMADAALGVIGALFLFTAAALLVTGAWVPPLGLVLAAVMMLGRSGDAMIEAVRKWRRRPRPGRLTIVPPVPPRP
jgi:hypothetical protein